MDLTNATAIVTAALYEASALATVRRLAQNRLHRTLAATAKQVCATGTLSPCSPPTAGTWPVPSVAASRASGAPTEQ
ncbi:MAG: hypothetical protein QOI48_4218 [Solirubrobacteraceae bacterium]|jgi:hypothetical protein|nr:hypothetical protein [Solirubrobacteraceae bacterium]